MDTKSGALDFQDVGATWPSGLALSAGRPRLAGVAGAAGARWPPLKPVVPAIWSALTRRSGLTVRSLTARITIRTHPRQAATVARYSAIDPVRTPPME